MKIRKVQIKFYFEFFEDEIVYTRNIIWKGNYTYNMAQNYAKSWIEKFGNKYGTCKGFIIRSYDAW